MTSFWMLRMPRFMKFVSILCTQSKIRPLKSIYFNGSYHILQFLRLCSTERGVSIGNGENLCGKRYNAVRREAQAALLEYFHVTRNLHFLDAENMSKNSPEFLDRLLKGAGIDDAVCAVRHSLARFLRYHPVNEFEPFFESIGLEPSEYASFLPPNLMFLSDDELLLHNYHVLCTNGIASVWIGRIYKEATEIFSYERMILQSKLQSLLNFGLTKLLLGKIIASSPYLLRGNGNLELLEFLGKLKDIRIEYEWLEEHISEGDSYNWKAMLEVLCFLSDLGLTGEKLGEVIKNHPDLLLERSGLLTYRVLVFLLKFGSRLSDLPTMFLQFPCMPVVNFIDNLSHCYNFFVEINMSVEDIGRMFRLHHLLLGSCRLMKVHVLRILLSCGDDQLCQMVKDDPFVLQKWVLRMGPEDDLFLSSPGSVEESKKLKKAPQVNGLDLQERLKGKMVHDVAKTKFLSSLGFIEESEEMKRALKLFRGRGTSLQKSFNCLLKVGLSREDVIAMLKVAPNILSQSKDVIESKITCFVKELGYPLSDVVATPKILGYKIERVKSRFFMYEWLKNEGALEGRELARSSVLACSEEIFVRRYVNSHPRGPEFWEILKKKTKPKCAKTKFLLSLGFVAESEEMKKLLKLIRGKGTALSVTFDCLTNAGLSREDVIEILKKAPIIFSWSKDAIERRLDCFVRELGYPVSYVATFPDLLRFKPETIKLRLLMYELLKDEGALPQKLATITLFTCSEELFVKRYVNSHPKGPELWRRLRERIYSTQRK